MLNPLHLISIAFMVGFIGDTLLQIGSKYLRMGGPTGWGLKSYFTTHGSQESVVIAGGMMAFFYMIYYYIFQLPFVYTYLAIYGILLDLLFRKAMVFHTLEGYYTYFNYFWSAVWGAIPLMMPLMVYHVLQYMK